MVPFSIQEMREPARADVDQLVEDSRDHGVVVDLEVHAGIAR